MVSLVVLTRESLNLLISWMVSPFFFEILTLSGAIKIITKIPTRAAQPILVTRIMVQPTKGIGITTARAIVRSLCYKTPRSLASRLVNLPASEDRMTQEVRVETLA